MEQVVPYLPLLFASFLFLFVAYKFNNKSKSKVPLPPGPTPLPFIGNIHQVATNPLTHQVLKDLAKKHGPLMYLKLGELDTVVVSSPDVAEQVMKTHDLVFATRPTFLASNILNYNATGVIFTPYGDHWRQMRKISTIELLSHKRVESFRSIREEEAKNLIKDISAHAGETINLSRSIVSLVFGQSGRVLFGKKSKDHEVLMSLTSKFLPLISGFSLTDMYPSSRLIKKLTGAETKLEEIHEKQDEILQNIVNEHREKKTATTSSEDADRKDIVDVLLQVQENGDDFQFPLTDDNLKAVLLELFTAASETSSTTIEWAVAELLKNPELMKKTQAEVREVFPEGNVKEIHLHKLKYLQAVIKEALRLHPPAPVLAPRASREQCEINGYVIPKDSRVIINAYAISRTYWPEAERFIPERFLDTTVDYKGKDYEYIPFGSGRRACPAMTYAHATIQLPMAMLLYHFDWVFPDGKKPEDLDMDEIFGPAVRRKNNLHMIPVPYNPSQA